MLFIATLPLNVHAIENGDAVKYTSKRIGSSSDGQHSRVFEGTIDGLKFTGTCAQAGPTAASSGTGEIRRKITDARIRAIVYYLVYEAKAWQSPLKDKTLTEYFNISYDTPWKVVSLPMLATQVYIQGPEGWQRAWGEGVRSCGYVIDWYQNFDVSSVNVPRNFTMYYVDCGSDQNFVLWAFENQTGKLKLKKASANPGITG